MSNFFKEIVDYQQIYNLSETIDWLFDDNKFLAENGWRPEAVGRLTKKIKKLPYFGKDNYKYDAVKNLRFPKRQCRTIKAFFSNGNSESKDFIRHIRNGIAHGNARCVDLKKNELYIEIKDYKDHSRKNQTAYILIPISYLNKVHCLYNEVERLTHIYKKQRGK